MLIGDLVMVGACSLILQGRYVTVKSASRLSLIECENYMDAKR